MKKIIWFTAIISLSIVLLFTTIGLVNYVDLKHNQSNSSVALEINGLYDQLSDLYLDKSSYEIDLLNLNSKIDDITEQIENSPTEDLLVLKDQYEVDKQELENRILNIENEIGNIKNQIDDLLSILNSYSLLPSGDKIHVKVTSSGQVFQAPCNGYFVFVIKVNSANGGGHLLSSVYSDFSDLLLGTTGRHPSTGQIRMTLPFKKGQYAKCEYQNAEILHSYWVVAEVVE